MQRLLFPALEEELGPLTGPQQDFLRVIELARLERFMRPYLWLGIGCKPCLRLPLAKAFIAKAVWNLATTRSLIDQLQSRAALRRLCGWETLGDLPSESTFSRAFAAFAAGKLPETIHAALVAEQLKNRIVGHVSRDSTAIESRERAAPKPQPQPQVEPRKRGRPRKDEPPRPVPPPTRLELQPGRTLEGNLADLPRACDIGCKRDAKGFKTTWKGYKLHLDCIDGDIPASAVLTSASLHDSQAAIPLAQMTAGRVPRHLYDLMDSAYDCQAIDAYSRQLGHVPLIEANPRRGEARKFSPAEQIRYRERSTAERVNSNLKDNFGGRFVRVRGAVKVMCHLMFGVLALTALQLFHLLE
jgi:hypothetical protein